MNVVLFPGQGSQFKGMGKDLWVAYPEVADAASWILGYSIIELCLKDPQDQLRHTQFTQPALYVVNAVGYYRWQEAEGTPDALAGHSLGEYSALLAAGCFDFETGLRLVQKRGQLMSEASGGTMAAVLGLRADALRALLDDKRLDGIDQANLNSPTQSVVTSDQKSIAAAQKLLSARDVQCIVLNVSAPFHWRYMREAQQAFAEFLRDVALIDPRITVNANATARPYPSGEVAELLEQQIASPVLWTDSIRYLMGQGELTYAEMGADLTRIGGAVLSKLVDEIRRTETPLPVEQTPTKVEPPVSRVTPPATTVASAAQCLGNRAFRERYGLKYSYVAGAMYRGTASPALVARMGQAGEIQCAHRVLAKVSRLEVAEAFMSPAPAQLVDALRQEGAITAEQAAITQQVPMSHDVCVEADSGGHTDGGTPTILLPAMQRVRQTLVERYPYREPVWPDEAREPTQASVHGLMGSLAKEYPNWRISLLDLPKNEDVPLDTLLAQPPDAQGDARVWREGRWYRQRLVPCALPQITSTAYREGGVYVLLCWAGGIGVAFTEYLIRQYRAQVVWLGRRAEDEAIEGARARLGALGPTPLYLQADATERDALESAHAMIHGVVHTAIVLADRSLANMEEANFAAALSAKAATTEHLVEVFGDQPLDFMLFFSSLQSFSKARGQSNYAAGCCYADAYAHGLRDRPYAVKVAHWSYWGSVGVVASAPYRERMAQMGICSIEPPEAMAVLERLLAGPLHQDAFAKTTQSLAMNEPDTVELCARAPRVSWADAATIVLPQAAHDAQRSLEQHLGRFLWARMSGLGWLGAQSPGLAGGLGQWHEMSPRLLNAQGPGAEQDAPEWEAESEQWRRYCEQAEHDTVLGAQVRLVNATLKGGLIFSDCALVVDPDARELAEIAMAAADNAQSLLMDEPRVAMLSFSTSGSARHAAVDKVVKVTRLVREQRPILAIDGNVQLDAAIVARKIEHSNAKGRANVLVFPSLEAGNISYKLAERVGGAKAIGPLLQGLRKPANDLSHGCSADDIYYVIAVTVVQAQAASAGALALADMHIKARPSRPWAASFNARVSL